MSIAEATAANDAYHAKRSVSSTQVAAFLDDRIEWYRRYVTRELPPREPTAAMEFGTNVHLMIELGGPDKVSVRVSDDFQTFDDADTTNMVEEPTRETCPSEFADMFSNGHINRRKGAYQSWKKSLPTGAVIVPAGRIAEMQAYTDWLAEHAGKAVIVGDEPNPYEAIWANLQANSVVQYWTNLPRKEEEFEWADPSTGIRCRAKLDLIDDTARVVSSPVVVDWKTTRSISARGFQNECHSRHYAIRLALYQRAYKARYDEMIPIVAVAIENKGSYRVVPYEIDESWLDYGHEKLDRTLRQMSEFDVTAELNQPIVTLGLPRYARFDSEYEVEA